MNANVRALEQARAAAEPSHLDALLAFAERAYRRPLTKAEQDDLLAFYRSLRDQRLSHEDAIRDAVVSVLMSPHFCYRVDPLSDGHGARRGRPMRPLSDYALASRLSYFLWSSMPDEELMKHAAAGDLHKPDVLAAQARRMLQDGRVRGLATEFAGNWLDIRRFEEHNAVDRERFPSFTNELREAMFEEPIRFVLDVIQRERLGPRFPLRQLHVRQPGPGQALRHAGAARRRTWVRVDDAQKYARGGLLPMSVFLTKNAPGLRTSPVKRGYWVVHRLLGEYIPAPPPNVPVLPTDETKLGDLTLRETLAQHRANPACASCHAKFDSFGLVVRRLRAGRRDARRRICGPAGRDRRDVPRRQRRAPASTGCARSCAREGRTNSSTTCAASCWSTRWAAACCSRTSRSSPTCASIWRRDGYKFGRLVQRHRHQPPVPDKRTTPGS